MTALHGRRDFGPFGFTFGEGFQLVAKPGNIT
jgi:hypothetical protein